MTLTGVWGAFVCVNRDFQLLRIGSASSEIRALLGYFSTVIVASHDIGSAGILLTQVRYTSSVLVAVMV
jgi:hypothetical protein